MWKTKIDILKKLGIVVGLACCCMGLHAQTTNGVAGLLHMPNADMERQGTVVLGGNYLEEHNNNLALHSEIGGYNTFNYYLDVTVLPWLEISYVCTLFHFYVDGVKTSYYNNQDRHFVARVRPIKEGQFWKYMPAVVLGVSDPTTGSGGDYLSGGLAATGSTGNGYFNVWYAALTKHFDLPCGVLGAHVVYMYNRRHDYPVNGPAVGADFRPSFAKSLDVIAEYDAKTVNVGAKYSLWYDHLNLMVEMQKGRYFSGGVSYKVNLAGGNKW
jgi:hypothetical protein